MSAYILDKTYVAANEDGIGAYKCVVQGENPCECQLPSKGVDCLKETCLGVTVHSQQYAGSNIAVRKAGIVKVQIAGPVGLGSPVMVCPDGSGRIVPIQEPYSLKRSSDYCMLVECLGFAETSGSMEGDIVEIFLSFHQRMCIR